MARPLRIEFAGAVYHVTSRGDRREAIYLDDKDRELWLEILGVVCDRFDWRCHAWVQMDNHCHLVVETADGNLSKGMRHLNSVYTQTHNRRHGSVGHVYQGRYKGILVDKESYLLELSRYVVLNPLREKMVSKLSDWHWSSFKSMIGKATVPDWMETDWLLGHFGRNRRRAVSRYIEFVGDGKGLESIWNSQVHPVILGDEVFVESIYRKYVDEATSQVTEINRLERRYRGLPLASYFDADEDNAFGIVEAYRSGEFTQKEIAEYCGVHYSTVSRYLKKLGY